jgi:predicted small secreted protein
MLKLIATALASVLLLSSCSLISNTLKIPGRTIQSLGRTVGF